MTDVGSHCHGTVFLNGDQLETEALRSAMDCVANRSLGLTLIQSDRDIIDLGSKSSRVSGHHKEFGFLALGRAMGIVMADPRMHKTGVTLTYSYGSERKVVFGKSLH